MEPIFLSVPVSTADVEFLGEDLMNNLNVNDSFSESTKCICIDPQYYCTECCTYGHKALTCSCPTVEMYRLEENLKYLTTVLGHFLCSSNRKKGIFKKIDEISSKIENIRIYIKANAIDNSSN